MAERVVTSTADSGAGTLRKAIADAQAGDVILFDPVVFPVGETTAIYLSSYLTVNKSLLIYGGFADGDGGYTSGATLTRYVKREVEGVETEVVVDEEHPALEGETVLLHVTTRVALDGQAAQDPSHTGDWDGWTGSRILYVASATNVDVETTISGLTFQNGLCTASEYSAVWGTAPSSSELQARFEDCKVANCVNSNGYGGGVTLRSLNVANYTFIRCEFRDCKAKSNAGCFYTRDNASATFTDCTFSTNTATNYGGAVSSTNTSANTFTDCTFSTNTANSGGAVYSTNTSANTFTDCTFSTNTANSGGAVYSYGTSANTFTDCTFSTNTATNYGGAVSSYLLSDIRLKGTTLFEDCEAATGSAIYNDSLYYIDDSGATYNNCSLVNAVNPDSVQTRYFTNTADSGDGSFRATLAACNNGDTIEPDPTVFAKGSIVTIKTSSPLALNKRFYLRGAGRRIVFDAQGDHAVVSSSSAYALDAEDVDFINGATTGNVGTAFQGSTTQAVRLKRCTIAGCKGYRVIHSGSSLGFAIESSVIAGNFATDTSTFTNMYIAATGSTIAGNYIASGSSTANAAYFRNLGSVVQPLSSEAGFRVAPPDTLAAEDWDADLWKQWDLSLTAESPYASTSEDWSEEAKRWAPDGEWRYDLLGLPRKDAGAAGAFEYSGATLYWTGYDVNGDAVVSPSFTSAAGWSSKPQKSYASDAIPGDGDVLLVRSGASFAGTLDDGVSSVILAGSEDISGTFDGQFIDAGTFAFSGELAIAGTATLESISSDAELVVSGTLNVGSNIVVDSLTLANDSSVVFSTPGIFLTATNSATIGTTALSCSTANAYFAIPAETTISSATFSNVIACNYGADVTSFSATATGARTIELAWEATDSSVPVLLEKHVGDTWEVIAQDDSGSYECNVSGPGAYEFRVFDGVHFTVDSAWTGGGGLQFKVVGIVVGGEEINENWKVITEVIGVDGAIKTGQSVTILTRIYDAFDDTTPLLNNGSNITSIVYTLEKRSKSLFDYTWTPVTGHDEVEVDTNCVLESLQTSDAWTVDQVGYNFALTPDTTEHTLFESVGTYRFRVKITLAEGNPVVFYEEITVTE